MDVSVGTRLRVLRKDAGLTQAQLAALADTNQAAINRYETDRAAAPYRILVWYATYFNVSLDYIFGLCEDPRGRYVCVTPEGAQEVVQIPFRAAQSVGRTVLRRACPQAIAA